MITDRTIYVFIPFQNRQMDVDLIPGPKDERDDPIQMSWQETLSLNPRFPMA